MAFATESGWGKDKENTSVLPKNLGGGTDAKGQFPSSAAALKVVINGCEEASFLRCKEAITIRRQAPPPNKTKTKQEKESQELKPEETFALEIKNECQSTDKRCGVSSCITSRTDSKPEQ